MNQTVTLEIAGSRYRLTTDADEATLQELAAIVNDRITALGVKANRTASAAQMLAVVALGLAEEKLEADRQRDAVEKLAREAVGKAIERIDRRLSEDAELARRAETDHA